MSPTDLAKDAIRIVTTAGLSKDVIDLLKEKVMLLDEKVQALSQENSALKSENYDLRKRLESVETGTFAGRPEGFDDTTDKILDILFDHPDGASIEWIASRLGLDEGMAHYHFDLLFRKKFAQQLTMGMSGPFGSSSGSFGLTSAGRAYVVERRSQ